jgi:hypothetical protein
MAETVEHGALELVAAKQDVGGEGEDVWRLTSEMIREDFSTTITANDGTVYELPSAEYVYDYLPGEHVTREEIRDKAVRAASRVARSFVVLLSVSVSWAWVRS